MRGKDYGETDVRGGFRAVCTDMATGEVSGNMCKKMLRTRWDA